MDAISAAAVRGAACSSSSRLGTSTRSPQRGQTEIAPRPTGKVVRQVGHATVRTLRLTMNLARGGWPIPIIGTFPVVRRQRLPILTIRAVANAHFRIRQQ